MGRDPRPAHDRGQVGEVELQPLVEVPLVGGPAEVGDGVVARGEAGPQPAFGGLYAYGDGEVGLPGPRRPEEDGVLGALGEPEALEVEQFLPVELGELSPKEIETCSTSNHFWIQQNLRCNQGQ